MALRNWRVIYRYDKHPENDPPDWSDYHLLRAVLEESEANRIAGHFRHRTDMQARAVKFSLALDEIASGGPDPVPHVVIVEEIIRYDSLARIGMFIARRWRSGRRRFGYWIAGGGPT